MDHENLVLAVLVLGVLAYAIRHREGSEFSTAGDDERTIIDEGIEEMNSVFSNWPTGSGPYQHDIEFAAARHGVPVSILAWLLWKESSFIPAVIDGTRRSRVGAMGIAQFMPATAREELGSEAAALDPVRAIPGAARYLAKLYRSAGSWAGALAAYNWGIGNVTRRGLAAAPPETVNYYTTILARAKVEEGETV